MPDTPETAHYCEFPVLPPHSILDPGPCECGKTYLASTTTSPAGRPHGEGRTG